MLSKTIFATLKVRYLSFPNLAGPANTNIAKTQDRGEILTVSCNKLAELILREGFGVSRTFADSPNNAQRRPDIWSLQTLKMSLVKYYKDQ